MTPPGNLFPASHSAPLVGPDCGPPSASSPVAPGAKVRAPGYPQRRPQDTVLYKVVADNLETFLQEARDRTEHGFGYPKFIERTFRNYLECGIFAHGFCRLRCKQCGKDMLLPFKKDLEVCPHCGGLRVLIALTAGTRRRRGTIPPHLRLAGILPQGVHHRRQRDPKDPLPRRPAHELAQLPPVAAARAPPQLNLDYDDDWPE